MKFLETINDVDGSLNGTLHLIEQNLRNDELQGAFALCIAGTESSDVSSISAAGASPELCRNTPAADAEALVLGSTAEGNTIPVSPDGIVSPVVITRACLSVVNFRNYIFDCGAFKKPAIPTLRINDVPARCLSTGNALGRTLTEHLFEQGMICGRQLASKHSFLVIAECVPGGTTTALAVLTALNFCEKGLVSGSHAVPTTTIKQQLIAQGFKNSGLKIGDGWTDPFRVMASLGDPMQPFVIGMAMAAAASKPVILAGGSMMLAIRGMVGAIEAVKNQQSARLFEPVIITTKWIGFDPHANTAQLSKLVNAHCLAACPDFSRSRHQGLRAYENGHVKEGVGAGAAMALAHMGTALHDREIVDLIDDYYDQLVHGTLPARRALSTASALA